MTPAEIKTLRESLGFTAQGLADWCNANLGGPKEGRAIQRYEEGSRTVPADVDQALRALDRMVTAAAMAEVEHQLRCPEQPVTVALVRYRTTEALHRHRPDMAEQGLPVNIHTAIMDRTRQGLERSGAIVRIAWLESDNYEASRAEN